MKELKKTAREGGETSVETRGRLLEAAGEIFAEHGFRGATVREICRRAGANVSAVNYHYFDKEGLYAAALKQSALLALQKYPPTWGLGPRASAAERLQAFIRALLFRLLDKGRPAWHGRLLAREMVDPTGALEGLIEELWRPLDQRLNAIVRELVSARVTEEQIRLGSFSIVGECVFYRHCAPVIARMAPEQKFERRDIEKLAEHITEFSYQALRNLPGGRKAGKKRGRKN